MLVNGGGAVTLQFQRAHFDPMTVTVPVLWNQVVVLDPIIMVHKNQDKQAPKEGRKHCYSVKNYFNHFKTDETSNSCYLLSL